MVATVLDGKKVVIWQDVLLNKGVQKAFLDGKLVYQRAINIIISANTNNVKLFDLAKANGWDGASPITLNVTVNSGVVIGSNSTSAPSLDSSGFPTGMIVNLYNYGYILGQGGAGGDGGPFSYTDTFSYNVYIPSGDNGDGGS